eukprot:6476726-Amphidinium_carterae.1
MWTKARWDIHRSTELSRLSLERAFRRLQCIAHNFAHRKLPAVVPPQLRSAPSSATDMQKTWKSNP